MKPRRIFSALLLSLGLILLTFAATRSQFETFARCAVNSPLPNESSADLKATADTLRKALDEGTQIIL